jgi:hypothetical protein
MLRLSKYKVLREAAKLVPSELQKPNGATGESRIDILIRLIKNGSPIELASGGSVTIQNTPELIKALETWKNDGSSKKFPIGFLDIKDKAYTSSDLAKSKVFGGGMGGAGGGTLNTKQTESHQCVMIQAMLDHGIQDIDYFTDDIIKDAYKKVFVDGSLEDILGISDSWKSSSYHSAIILIKEGYVNKNQTFHRGDNKMVSIYAAKDLAFKNNGFPSLKDDKWNPGDIWAIDKSFNISKELNISSVSGINRSILEHFVSRRLVGISLKLVKKSAKKYEYNIKLPPDTDDYKMVKIKLESDKGDFWSSKGGTIIYDDGELNLKDNSAGGSVKAELRMKTARGGGAGWGIMIDGMRQVFGVNLSSKFTATIFKDAKSINKGDKKSILKMFKMYNEFYKNESFDSFEEQLKSKDMFWISSKLGVLTILYYVNKNTGLKANRFITKIINYAGSKSEDSSTYVKVYE